MKSKRDRIHAMRVAGLFTKGLVYVLIGALTASAAFGLGGEVAGTRTLADFLAELPAGILLVAITTLGLGAYSSWRFYEAVTGDPGASRDRALKRVGTRLAALGSALAYGASCLVFAGVLLGEDAHANGGSTLLAELLRESWGEYAIVAFGLILLAVSLAQFRHAFTASFMEKLDQRPPSPAATRAVERLGRVGYAARGVVGSITTYFVYQVVDAYSASEYTGTEGVFYWLLRQDRGELLMGAVALGMVAYGGFQLVVARYSSRWGVAT